MIFSGRPPVQPQRLSGSIHQNFVTSTFLLFCHELHRDSDAFPFATHEGWIS